MSATRSASTPSVALPRIARLSMTVAPGHRAEAHQPTERLGIPAEAETSQKSRLRRSLPDTGALETSRRSGPSLSKYHEVPSGGRSERGDPAGRTRVSVRTPRRRDGTPVARSVQSSGGERRSAGHQP